jgi:precorrin-6Y C5,15-methyltransferase (decarboxylating)
VIDVVGLTARGWEELPVRLRVVITAAEVLVGGHRQLGLVPVHMRQQVLRWPTPLRAGLPDLLASVRGRRVVALASGDPLLSGIGTTLVELLGSEEVRVHPAVSSVALARARLGWSAESTETVTLVGRDLNHLGRHLAPGARLVVLSADADTPAAVASLLVEAGFGATQLTVLGDLGGDQESRRSGSAASWTGDSPRLHVLALDCRADGADRVLSCVPGLPDEAYEHDGQLTKRDVRAAALAHLGPLPGQLLWDIGAGAGSVGIEWSRAHPRCRAVAVEREPDRADRIRRNAARLGVPELAVVQGAAPAALAGLERPDAVFLGGGGTRETVRSCWEAIRPGGRLVAHAVTVETEQVLHEASRAWGGALSRISVETLRPIGGFTGWTPARAVVQWSAVKVGS